MRATRKRSVVGEGMGRRARAGMMGLAVLAWASGGCGPEGERADPSGLATRAAALTDDGGVQGPPAGAVAVDALHKGKVGKWYGTSFEADSSYVAGYYGDFYFEDTYRTYFAFAIAADTGPIREAWLTIRNPAATAAAGTYTLREVVTPVEKLKAFSEEGGAVYADLGEGTVYGKATLGVAKPDPLVLKLEEAAVSALNARRGGLFVLGGDYASGAYDFLFGASQGLPASAVQLHLVLEQAAQTPVDTTAPRLSVPVGLVAEATSALGAPVVFYPESVSATDDSGIVTIRCTAGPERVVASGDVFPLGTTSVHCTATDPANNTSTGSFTVTVQDTRPPTIRGLPGDLRVEATGPTGAFVRWTSPSASDRVSGSVPVGCEPDSGRTFPFGTTTVTCSASDSAGHAASERFTVTVSDTTAPVPSEQVRNRVAEATGPGGAVVVYAAPVFTDRVSEPVSVRCSPLSGFTFPLGLSTVSCSATDARGNTSAPLTFGVDVVDTLPPLLTLPPDLTLEATGPGGAVATYAVGAVDLVSGAVPVACTPESGSTFPPGVTTTVTCSTTDEGGRSASDSFRVTVEDTTAPSLGSLGELSAEATEAAGAPVHYSLPEASDAVDAAVEVVCAPAPGSVFHVGSTWVECTATDDAGNSASRSFHLVVRDTTPPVVKVPGDKMVSAASAEGAVVSYAALAEDSVDGLLEPLCVEASGSLFAPGTSTVSCSATDSAGNVGSASFRVSVSVNWSGLLPPIDPDGSSVFRQGKTVPVRFRLHGTGADARPLSARLFLSKVDRQGRTSPEREAESADGRRVGNHFRRVGDHYHFNLATRRLSPGTWLLRVDLGDDVTRTALVKLRD